jgi:hypothetical protein
MILTLQDLQNIFIVHNIHEYTEVTVDKFIIKITFRDIRWYSFIRKYRIKKCIKSIEDNKSFGIYIEYKYIKYCKHQLHWDIYLEEYKCSLCGKTMIY